MTHQKKYKAASNRIEMIEMDARRETACAILGSYSDEDDVVIDWGEAESLIEHCVMDVLDHAGGLENAVKSIDLSALLENLASLYATVNKAREAESNLSIAGIVPVPASLSPYATVGPNGCVIDQ